MSLAFIRAAKRVCKYCKGDGHTKLNCPHALSKALEITDAIDLIINSRRREEERLFHLFTAEQLTDLCFLMNTPRTKQCIQILVRDGSITEAVAKMRYKRDRVHVLMWIYWFSSREYQILQERNNKIKVKTPEIVTDLSEFECPICVTDLPAKEKVEPGGKHCVCKGCLVSCLEHQIMNMDYTPPRCSMCRDNFKELIVTNPDYLDEVVNLAVLM
jgi:hypothetical protein